jgi:hypothetical protein
VRPLLVRIGIRENSRPVSALSMTNRQPIASINIKVMHQVDVYKSKWLFRPQAWRRERLTRLSEVLLGAGLGEGPFSQVSRLCAERLNLIGPCAGCGLRSSVRRQRCRTRRLATCREGAKNLLSYSATPYTGLGYGIGHYRRHHRARFNYAPFCDSSGRRA